MTVLSRKEKHHHKNLGTNSKQCWAPGEGGVGGHGPVLNIYLNSAVINKMSSYEKKEIKPCRCSKTQSCGLWFHLRHLGHVNIIHYSRKTCNVTEICLYIDNL